MGLQDCPKCWETPCACGHEYKSYPLDRRLSIAAAALGMSVEELTEMLIAADKYTSLSNQEKFPGENSQTGDEIGLNPRGDECNQSKDDKFWFDI